MSTLRDSQPEAPVREVEAYLVPELSNAREHVEVTSGTEVLFHSWPRLGEQEPPGGKDLVRTVRGPSFGEVEAYPALPHVNGVRASVRVDVVVESQCLMLVA